MQRTINTKEAAVLFGRSPRTIRRRARQGQLPGVKRTGRWVFDPIQLSITWNAVMAGRKPSSRPAEDLQQLYQLLSDIERGEVAIFEGAQQEALDLALALLATSGAGAGRIKAQVWEIIQHLRGNPNFSFFTLIPSFGD